MSEDRIREVLRRMAWIRAQAELKSILDTYYPGDIENWSELHTAVYEFIDFIEDNFLG